MNEKDDTHAAVLTGNWAAAAANEWDHRRPLQGCSSAPAEQRGPNETKPVAARKSKDEMATRSLLVTKSAKKQ